MISEMHESSFCEVSLGARLRVSGSDAATFLQGQFSNDLRREGPRPITYGLWLNHKGRVLADSEVLRREDGSFEVLSLGVTAETLRARLEPYVVADDVEFADVSPAFRVIGFAGSGVETCLDRVGVRTPNAGRFAVLDGDGLVWAGRGAWWVVVPAGAAEAFRALVQADAGLREVSFDAWEWERVRAGVPRIPLELGPGDLPQEGGIESVAVSLTKGCFLGQEVMARLHNLGQVRRGLFVVEGAGARADVPVLPAPLLGASGKTVGELRSRFRVGDDWAGMAMLSLSLAVPGEELRVNSGAGGIVRVVRRVGEGGV